MTGSPSLPPAIEQGLAARVAAAREALGPDLVSVVLHGSAAEGRLRPASDVNLVLVLRVFDGARAAALRPALDAARVAFGASPMFLLESEIAPAAEAFAVKLADVARRRRVLFGADPFAACGVPRAAQRDRLRQVLLDQVIRMRARFLRAGRAEGPLADAIADAAGPLRAAAASLLELEGTRAPSSREALAASVRGEPALEAAVAAMSRAREAGPLPLAEATEAYLGLLAVAERLRQRAARLE